MTARGTPRVDLRFRGVGRVRVAAGTTRPAVVSAMRQMCHDLYELGRLDVLEALRDGRVTLLQVYGAWKRDRDRLPSAEALRPAAEMLAWTDTIANPETRHSYYYGIRSFLHASPPDATLMDIPAHLRAYRLTAKGRVAFNRTRAGVLAFFRDTLGKRHVLYLDAKDVPCWTESPRPANPFTVAELAAATELMGEPYSRMAWTMALTGMRRGEYWGTWALTGEGVTIKGSKTRGSLRDVPYVGLTMKPTVTYRAFLRRLTAVAPGHTVHSLRHTYAHWMEEARIPRSRRRMYMGHGKRDVTDIYERHEVRAYLREDAERLVAYLKAELPQHLTTAAPPALVAPTV